MLLLIMILAVMESRDSVVSVSRPVFWSLGLELFVSRLCKGYFLLSFAMSSLTNGFKKCLFGILFCMKRNSYYKALKQRNEIYARTSVKSSHQKLGKNSSFFFAIDCSLYIVFMVFCDYFAAWYLLCTLFHARISDCFLSRNILTYSNFVVLPWQRLRQWLTMKTSLEEPLYNEVFRVLLGLQSQRPSLEEKWAWNEGTSFKQDAH